MSHDPDKDKRIGNAIDSLIAHVVPSNPYEAEEDAQERHDATFDLVRELIDKYATPLDSFLLQFSPRHRKKHS